MKLISACFEAVTRRLRNVASATLHKSQIILFREMGWYYAQGHPQCLKNVITVGLPSLFGMGSSDVDGALDPIEGGSMTSTVERENQDGYSWKIEPMLVKLVSYFPFKTYKHEAIYGVLKLSLGKLYG